MIKLPPPKFVANTEDNMHCVPACWRMVLETYFPDRIWSFEQIDRIIHKEEGKYVWPETFWPSLLAAGVSLHLISTWDYQAFLERRWDYMRERNGEAYTKRQIEKAPNLKFILEAYARIQKDCCLTKTQRAATLQDIEGHLSQGAYIGVAVNAPVLRGAEGTCAHAVLLYGIDEKAVYLQNPGVPPRPEQMVPLPLFLKAWNFGCPENYSLLAYYRRGATAHVAP